MKALRMHTEVEAISFTLEVVAVHKTETGRLMVAYRDLVKMTGFADSSFVSHARGALRSTGGCGPQIIIGGS